MALQIQQRNGTATALSTSNLVYKAGEPVFEYDTGQFKIGDGTTAYNTLSYAGTAGATQSLVYRSFGDGSDGSVTISSGTTTLTRDMYYLNLTMSGTGILVTNGYKVFVKAALDITAAQAAAIQWNGNVGGNASAATGGTIGAAQAGGTVGAILGGGAGSTATTGNGTGGTGATFAGSNSSVSGAGGGGGTGTSGTGGAGGAARTSAFAVPFSRYETSFIIGTTLISGGPGGSGGGSGAGDGSNNGGGGGAGGNGGGLVVIYANRIVKGTNTPAGVIVANGGNGGNGGNTSAGVTGGGGGGGGGCGGWIYIMYNDLYGPIVKNLVQTNGGLGGNGGNGTGSGATGGAGGNAGAGGRINIKQIQTTTSVNSVGVSNLSIMPELVGTLPTLGMPTVLNGGGGGFNGMLKADL